MITGAALGAVTTAAGISLYKRLTSSAKTASSRDAITLYYHEGFSGRCEGPMLLLQDLGVPYERSSDVGAAKIFTKSNFVWFARFADGQILSQSVAICVRLGVMHGAATDDLERLATMISAALNAENCWSEAYRCLQGSKAAALARFHTIRPLLGLAARTARTARRWWESGCAGRAMVL